MSSPSKPSDVKKYDVHKVIARALNINNKDNFGLLDGASSVTITNNPLASVDPNTDGITLLEKIAKDIDVTPSKRAAKRSKLDGRQVASFCFPSCTYTNHSQWRQWLFVLGLFFSIQGQGCSS